MGRVCQRRWWAGLDVCGRALICVAPMAAMVAGCVHAQTRSQVIPYSPPPTEVPTMELDTLETATERALEDAERRTGVARSELTVISAEAVTWADGSLGCPEPGMSYTMALVPGYRIRVKAGEQLLDYHASRRGYFVLCPDGRSEDPAELPDVM